MAIDPNAVTLIVIILVTVVGAVVAKWEIFPEI